MFLASFLVLFLEVALIRWMPAYIRLLAYFSNFILLASFLGIGVGCLLAPSRRAAVRLVPAAAGGRHRGGLLLPARGRGPDRRAASTSRAAPRQSRCSSRARCCCRSSSSSSRRSSRRWRSAWAARWRRCRRLRGYTLNLLGSLAGVGLFAVISWLQLSPTWWFGLGFAAAVPLLLVAGNEPAGGSCARAARSWRSTSRCWPSTLVLVHVMARGVVLVAVLQDHRRPAMAPTPSSRSTTSSTSRWRRWSRRNTSTSGRTWCSATRSRTC